MALQNTNWVYEHGMVSDRDRAALAKAKRMEEYNIKKGHRWYAINNRTQVLVECDKDGQPTKRGRALIDRIKKL